MKSGCCIKNDPCGTGRVTMRLASIALMTVITAFIGSSATADEKPVRLPQAPGLDQVEAHCSACHSLDYVQMNSPFLSPAGWDAEVAKMINAFGAQIDQADAKDIADYLNQNYGIESSSLEKDKSIPEPTSSNLKSVTARGGTDLKPRSIQTNLAPQQRLL